MTAPIEYKIKDYTEARDAINQMIGSFEMLRMVAKNYGERLGDAPITDGVQAQVEQPVQPTPSKGWIIGRVRDGEIDTVSIVYSDECDVDQEIVNFATNRPDTTYMKMEIKAYVKANVKAKVEAVWS